MNTAAWEDFSADDVGWFDEPEDSLPDWGHDERELAAELGALPSARGVADELDD